MSSVRKAEKDVFIVVAPAGRDANVIGELLKSASLGYIIDPNGEDLLKALATGDAAGAIMTDDSIARLDVDALHDAIEDQPTWSDFPFILLTRRGEPRQGSRVIEQMANVTVLERPLHPATLLSAGKSALRARQRQRLAARHLLELEEARAELKEFANTLEAKVEARTRDLAMANDRLTKEIAERERAEARLVQAQKMEALGQLTGGIAHDFNNLLTAVVGSLDLLLRRTDDEKLQKLASNALHAAQRGAQLTSQLLSFSRRQRLSPASVQANEIVSGMGDLIARTIGPQIRVETRLEPDLWLALADPTQLEMMILNLAINARDAMPRGGRLTITTRNEPPLSPSLATELEPGDYISIAVSDTGTGMPPAVLAKAFEPFFTTKEHGKGTGLGLAQLYGFAKQSGGTARIESREGEGTTVTIYLPRTEAGSGQNAPAHVHIAPGRRAKILIVDDDDDVRMVAAAMIEDLGYQVEAAHDGSSALETIQAVVNDRRRAIDLIITDVVMPGMSGVELARRAHEIAPALPIVFASGYADIETFGRELSDEAVLKKPYRMTEMAARINAALAESTGKAVGEKIIPFPMHVSREEQSLIGRE